MKAFTDIEQSKKLAKILPLESADMYYSKWYNDEDEEYHLKCGGLPKLDFKYAKNIPAWSLAALLDNIPQIKLDNVKHDDKKYWRCCAYYASDWHTSKWYYNPIDACVEMIENLHNKMVYDFNN